MKFLHLGIPTESMEKDKAYSYVEHIKLHVTNPDDHQFKVQFVWAEPDSPLPEIVRKEKHLSIQVDNLEEAIKPFDSVVYPPKKINEKLRICFAVKDGVLFELMEIAS
jgi:hypothetical protein